MTRRAKRVAALYDVHGNVAALDAVLEEVRAEGADLVVFGGDLAWGPFPRAAVERVMDFGLPALHVRGNADRSVGGDFYGEEGWVFEVTSWCSEQLEARHREFLLGQSPSVTVAIEGCGDVFFCHGSPRSDEEALTTLTPEDRLGAAVAGVDAGVVVCGHTHIQFERTSGVTRVVNAGSVGLPYEGVPGAYWALIGETISLRRTAYDFEAAARDIAASGCPYAEDFAKDVPAPPAKEAVARQFEGLPPF